MPSPQDTVVDIPGVGHVAFPASMSKDQLDAAAKKVYEDGQRTKTPRTSAQSSRSLARLLRSNAPTAAIQSAVSRLKPTLVKLAAQGALHVSDDTIGSDYRNSNDGIGQKESDAQWQTEF